MSEKHLTESPWKMLVSKQKIKDPGLAKTLAGWERSEGTDVAKRTLLLDAIAKQAKALKVEQKGVKEIVVYLDEMLTETEKARKALKLQGAKEKEEDEDAAEEENEEDAAAAAPYKSNAKGALLAALAKVRTSGAAQPGEEPPPAYRFIAYFTGANGAVLVAKSVGGLRALLPQLAGGAAGGKFVQGTCIFEKGLHTFVVSSVPGGLAPAISRGLQTVTGKKFRVRVRAVDGSTEDEAGETEEDEADAGATPAAQFQARRQGIEAAYLASVRSNSPNAGKIRAVLAYIDGAAEAGDLAKATTGLDKLEALLASKDTATDPALLQAWSGACSGVRDLLRQVQDAVVSSADFNADPAIMRLQSVSKNLAHQPATRQEVDEMESWILSDDLITLLETPNPFGIDVKIREPLLPILQRWKEALPA